MIARSPHEGNHSSCIHYGLQILATTAGEIEGVKILHPDEELVRMHSDILGPEMVVKSIDIWGSIINVDDFCTYGVKDQLNALMSEGSEVNPCKMACFHAKLFVKHYLPDTQWPMGEEFWQWDKAVLDLMHELQQGS